MLNQKPEKIKLLHIITSAGIGGAEAMLYKLIQVLSKDKYEIFVVVLTQSDVIGKKIEQLLNVTVTYLGINKVNFIWKMLRLSLIIKKISPDIVQTWMYHADFIGGIAAKIAGVKYIIWGVRQSEVNALKYHTKLLLRLCAFFSYSIPTTIITNSKNAKENHIHLGYSKNRFKIVANGFDINQYYSNNIIRQKIRSKLNITDDHILIGTIGRFHKDKDYKTLIDAASYVCKINDNIIFLLCGKNLSKNNTLLMNWIKERELSKKFFLLSTNFESSEVLQALDIFVLSSITEGFPNVIGEAMACEVPCVVTDVGDCRLIVKDTGIVVNKSNAVALAQGIIQMISKDTSERRKLGAKARKIIVDNYSLPYIIRQFENLYQSLSE